MKYFASISGTDAELLLQLIARTEIADSLNAQDGHTGRRVTEALGLASHLKNSEASAKRISAQVKAIGKKLKWEARTIEAGKFPSMAFVAKSVGETKLYRHLYHASSRYVHFSPAELMRRAWGKTGEVSISSGHYNDYWASFVLYWGVYLLASTLPIALELGSSHSGADDKMLGIDGEKLIAAAKRIGEYGAVPIITAEELAWGSSPPK